jgi:hypothetical protein
MNNIIPGLLFGFCAWWALTILCACVLAKRRESALSPDAATISPMTDWRQRTTEGRPGRRMHHQQPAAPFHTIAPAGGWSAAGIFHFQLRHGILL